MRRLLEDEEVVENQKTPWLVALHSISRKKQVTNQNINELNQNGKDCLPTESNTRRADKWDGEAVFSARKEMASRKPNPLSQI